MRMNDLHRLLYRTLFCRVRPQLQRPQMRRAILLLLLFGCAESDPEWNQEHPLALPVKVVRCATSPCKFSPPLKVEEGFNYRFISADGQEQVIVVPPSHEMITFIKFGSDFEKLETSLDFEDIGGSSYSFDNWKRYINLPEGTKYFPAPVLKEMKHYNLR